MFTLSLRGPFATIVALKLHGILLVTTFLIVYVHTPLFKAVVLLLFLVFETIIIKNAYANKDNLRFNSAFSKQHAFPSTRKIALRLNIFSWFMTLFFSVPISLILIFDAIPDGASVPLFAVGFYAGTMSSMDLILRFFSRHERKRDGYSN